MCLAPRLVSKQTSRCDRLTGLVSKYNEVGKPIFYKKIRPASDDFLRNNILVPCGKCSQCLKRRQLDLAARCVAEANKRGSMVFVTLTYDEQSLPLALSMDKVDLDTGECFRSGVFSSGSGALDFVPSGSDLEVFARSELAKMDKSKVRYVYSDFVTVGNEYYRYCITPSLCRRDVQLWLKSCRVQYEREMRLPLQKFSYVCCGEYGPVTHRPHYHIAFFGLSRTVVDWMCSRWSRKYGFTYVKQVNAVNPDGTNGFEIAAKYIGKYMSKGVFDCESVKNHTALKPRLMSSVGVGDEVYDKVNKVYKVISDNLLAYYRCYDLVGEYSIETGLRKDGSSLSPLDYEKIVSEIPKRSQFKIGNACFSIPNKVKSYVWKTKDCYGRYSSTVVRKEIATRLQFDFFEDYVRKLTKDYTIHDSREIADEINQFILVQNIGNEITEERGMRSLCQFYKQSKF